MKIYARRQSKQRIAADRNTENRLAIIDNYLPSTGEGKSFASQIATAVNKLIYGWYNNGDVYDNTKWAYEEGLNDISSCANWLAKYVPEMRKILDKVYNISSDIDYEAILSDIVDLASDSEDLENWAAMPKQGSIYHCDGPYVYEDIDVYDEDY